MTGTVAEYDVDAERWRSISAHVRPEFLPFSKTVYLSNRDMLVIGGLNQEIPQKPQFSSQCMLLKEVELNDFERVYVPEQLCSMHTKRGCFSTVSLNGFVYVFGGINYSDRIMSKCERYNLAENVWSPLTCLVEPRKNSSACVLNGESIYVFGGNSSYKTLDTIERYSVNANTWTLLKIRLPNPLAFSIAFKVSATHILLLGTLSILSLFVALYRWLH